jgi:hypothetical protein
MTEYNGRSTKDHVHEFPVSLVCFLQSSPFPNHSGFFYLSKIRFREFSRLAKNKKHFFWCFILRLLLLADEAEFVWVNEKTFLKKLFWRTLFFLLKKAYTRRVARCFLLIYSILWFCETAKKMFQDLRS